MNPMMDPDLLAARSESRATTLNSVYNFVYGWMAVALAVSGVVAWLMAEALRTGSVPFSPGLLMVCAVAEVALVVVLSWCIDKLAPTTAAILFMVYAALNGVTLSVLLLVYAAATVQLAFFSTAGMFAAMALVGTMTKRDLSWIGRYGLMLLLGIIIASVVNIFVGSSGLDLIITYVGVAVFVGLTAWDAQKVRALAESQGDLGRETVSRYGILCALSLYLDFINLFIYLLRILGRGGRE